MGLFAVQGFDRPGAGALRQATRADHLAYLETLPAGAVRVGGPMLGEDGAPVGSLLIYEAPDRATLDAWVAADPYATAGLFERVLVWPWRWVVGAPADLK
jgi:uncharacterized protein YciI